MVTGMTKYKSFNEEFIQLIFFFSLIFQEVLDEGTDPWGVKVERVEM